ncbi:MAG: hypothetical protein AAF921_18410 [Cyanobacteria bacterium P01_D01_bin.44]
MIDKLSKAEIEAFQKLKFNSNLRPVFDPMRYCLRWEDEEPESVSKDIYERFLDLLIARSYLHLGRPKDRWYSLEPTDYFRDFWDYANEVIPSWPGFMRLELTESAREYFEREVNRDPHEHL